MSLGVLQQVLLHPAACCNKPRAIRELPQLGNTCGNACVRMETMFLKYWDVSEGRRADREGGAVEYEADVYVCTLWCEKLD